VLPTLRSTIPGLTETAAPETRFLTEGPARLPPSTPVAPPPPDTSSGVPLDERFPMHVRHFGVHGATAGDPRQARFAEVFWADLSTAGEGTFRFLVRLFTAIFDLRFIAYVAAASNDLYFARVLRLALYFISWVLCGPIAGLTAFMGYLLGARYAASKLPDVLRLLVPSGRLGGVVLAAAAGLIGAGLLAFHKRLKWRGQWLAVVVWIIATAAGDAALIWSTGLSFSDNVSTLLRVLGVLFLVVAALTVCAFAVWLVARIQGPAKTSSFTGPALSAALTATLVQVGLWVIIVPMVGTAMLREWAPDLLTGKDPAFASVFLGYTQDLALAAVVAVAVIAVLVVRWLWVRRHPAYRDPATARGLPRLLVGVVIVGAILLTSLAGTAATFYSVVKETPRFGNLLINYRDYAVGLSVLIIAALGFFRKGPDNALHILMDVVSHFHRERLPVPSLRETEHSDPNDYGIQQRIEARFRAVLEEVLRPGDVTHLTVVAHSQGTMIAIDVLWLEWTANRLKNIDVSLVTMGSPLTHLYQYYFPHRYPALFVDPVARALNKDWGTDLTTTVNRWVNIYRVDDFVGTHIDGDSNGTFPRNICIGKGGHTGYWSEPEAIQEMRPYLPGRPATA